MYLYFIAWLVSMAEIECLISGTIEFLNMLEMVVCEELKAS
jgi:hypothetical protein